MHYEKNWESLNSRPVPQWFADAKFGIFIHWGIYSVPAFAGKGVFSEWYRYMYRDPDSPTKAFHDRVYGENFNYEEFVRDFKAELFDAKKWADLFQKSGARYINLVSKHHDGFCMYDSQYAWKWNSVDVGPHRDFAMELKEALEGTDVRFGVYHSLYEWDHPLYVQDPERYSVEHLIPMMKELIEKYQPATLFTDGEWEHPSSVWHAEEFLQWLYNESSVRDFVVPNDRWGSDTRGRLGGNFTSEYGIVIDGKTVQDIELDRPFEECRGIGGSFGYNRNEELADYLGPKELLVMLCDLVSKGGNLLLNIGPDGDGTIPVIMEERLLQIGDWLRVNGEAIYCSRIYSKAQQKGVYYTRRGEDVYAILDRFPFGEQLLELVDYDPKLKAKILGSDADVQILEEMGKVKLLFPPIDPETLDSSWLYTVKLTKEE